LKLKRYRNESYTARSGKVFSAKEFNPAYKCPCKKKCTDKIAIDELTNKSRMFANLADFNAQNAYIAGSISEVNKSRGTKNVESKRQFSRVYDINGMEVCKETFLKVYNVSSCRVNSVMKKKRLNDIVDKRGKKTGGWNKISPLTEQDVMNHINKFPKYVSHYCRESTETKFLSPELSLALMYRLYKEECAKPCSLSTYKSIFYKRFNLHFQTLKKDTCKVCDMLNVSAMNAKETEVKSTIKQKHGAHLITAKEAEILMKSDLVESSNNPKLETITFDLQKTMQLPRVPTNIVYYKRQLSLFNFGIHSGTTGLGYFYIWLEHEAGRGAQDVGSCISKYITDHVSADVETLIMWSDSCGGQNRNIKLTMMMQNILQMH